MRRVFIVLSPRSLPYARIGITSLFKNLLEPICLQLITDSSEDKQILLNEIISIDNPQNHKWLVFDRDEIGQVADEEFRGYDNLLAFRQGHPCWRKLTDPLLLSKDGEEVIILDPDLYFPNRFKFEPTLKNGVLLMWQKPNCLFPPECVWMAINAGIPLAHHVDIGVAHFRPPIDLEWFDWLLGQLGGASMPRKMHVEAIVWAAIAMRIGGGYLNPRQWRCWERSQPKRVMLKLGVSGVNLLKRENLTAVKCFHAGGEAKWWLPDAQRAGILDVVSHELDQPSQILPFEELTPQMYALEQRLKSTVRKLGYYKLFGGG